jgi:hypothetical protein
VGSSHDSAAEYAKQRRNSFMKRLLRRLASSTAVTILPKSLVVIYKKHSEEMAYWKKMNSKSPVVRDNAHYRYFYTSHFAIAQEEYNDRAILDIGCGPCGSWNGPTMPKNE